MFSHEFKGAASRVPVEATAFGLRRNHVMIEILASFPDRADGLEERRHQQWVRDTQRALRCDRISWRISEFARPG